MARSRDDNRDIPTINAWEDMTSRQAFSYTVHSKDELAKVVAPYRHLKPMMPCGLTDCGTPNASGYLIRTSDGRETNIGAICGKKHFPEFHAQAVQIDAIARERELRQRAAAAQKDADLIESEVAEIRADPHGAQWVERCVRRLRKALLDIHESLPSALNRRAANNNADVNIVRRKSKSERQGDIRVTGTGQTQVSRESGYAEQRVGRFAGLDVFLKHRDLKHLLVDGALAHAAALRKCDPDQDRYKDLARLMKAHGEIEAFYQGARWAVEAGRLFFTQNNLALLKYLSADPEIQRKISAITLARIEEG
jgi:hypothetical protein